MEEKNVLIVGHDTIRIDAWAKVKGKAKFGDDIKLNRPLYLKGVYPKFASAKIKKIFKEEALKVKDVIGIFDINDVLYKKTIGEIHKDQYIFVDDKVRYYGDLICIVAAETKEIAEKAAKLIKIEYDPLPVITEPKEAIKSMELINKNYPKNICGEVHVINGDIDEALKKSDIIIKDKFSTSHVEHAYIEPEVVVVEPSLMRDEITVYGSIQSPYNMRISISRVTGLPQSQIIIKPSNVGGSFGGKIETVEAMACRAAIVALKTKRNVKYTLTREESIRESYKRHPVTFDMELGATKDGHILGLKVSALSDAGAYMNLSPQVAYKTSTLGAGPYKMEALDYDTICVFTNNVHTGSMRGFGTPQALFAIENLIDQLAYKIGVSPLEIRKRNLLHNEDFTPAGHKLDFMEVSIEDCMNKCAKEIDYENKYKEFNEYNKKHKIKKGIGISVSMRGVSIGADANGIDVGRCLIEVLPDATVTLNIGLVEIGQGLRTCMEMMCAEGLGCDLSFISVAETDTGKAPITGACIASRSTMVGGCAIKDACDKIHKIMEDAIREKYKCKIDDIKFYDNKVKFNDKEITWKEAVDLAYEFNMTLVATGTWIFPLLDWKKYKDGMHGEAFYSYAFSCTMAEVTVDTETGFVEVKKMVGATDMGKAINPIMSEGQIYGGMTMAQGMGLTEDIGLDKKDGTYKHLNFDTYIIPTFADVPDDNKAILCENVNKNSAFGGHSLGEPATENGAAACAAACNMAIGKPGYIKSLPYDLDKVFFACRDLEKEEN